MSVQSEAVVRSLGLLFTEGTHCGLADAELLERFLAGPDEAAAHAFEGLVLRHGPMVLEVCTKVLGNAHDAQDAFQATFLVLATRARSIRRRRSVGSWLHGVALRVARRARSDAARRMAHERRIAEMNAREAVFDARGDEGDFRLLHEEVERLPQKYREPVVLCYLEGLTLEAAAGQLGCPVSTLGVRLMRAREKLKARLPRRGVSRADGLLVAGPAAGIGPAVLPGSLVRSTVGAAVRIASGAAVPTAAAGLTNGVVRSMAMARLAQVFAGILVATVGIGCFAAALGRPGPQAAGKPANPPAARVPESWIGKKVVIKWSAPLMEGDQVVGDNVFRVYTVDRVDGDRVKLTADDISGWIKAEDVVLLDRAIDFYTKVIEGNPKHLAARVKRALVREYLGDRARGIAELTEAIAIGPPYAVVYAVRGEMFQNDKEYDKAIADLTEAIRLDPDPVTYARRGQFWHTKGEYDKAIADYDESIRLDPNSALTSLTYINRGIAWSDKGEFDKGIADFSDAIELGSEDDGAAYRFRGAARLDKASRDRAAVPEEAIADLNEAIRLDPNDAEAYAQRSRAWVWKEDDDRAIADANRAIELKLQDSDVYLARGCAWLDREQFAKAIADFSEAIRLDPDDPVPYSHRGRAHSSSNEFDEAIGDFDQAIRRDPDNPEYYSRRGVAWFYKPDYDKAIADFDQVIRLVPRDVENRLYRGWAWGKKKEYDKALSSFDEVIHIEPKSPAGYCACAWIWATYADAKTRDGRRAVQSASKACELAEWKDEDSLQALAAAHAEAGDFDSAVKWQTKANAQLSGAEARADGEARLKLYREQKPFHAELP